MKGIEYAVEGLIVSAEAIYVNEPMDHNRFVVIFAAAYGSGDRVRTAKKAAAAALELTRDEGAEDTWWIVYDRQTGRTRIFEQKEFDNAIPEVVRRALA